MEATPGAPPTSTARDEPDRPGEPLNLKQVARELGVHYMTAYRYVRHGRLPERRHRQLRRRLGGSEATPFHSGGGCGTMPVPRRSTTPPVWPLGVPAPQEEP